MVSEGVDIPRLRVGVHATTTTTELFFRQAVGRIVRHTGGRGRAYMFVPDDARLRHFASTISESRRHRLERDLDDDRDSTPEERERRDNDEQLSLFTVHSATATEAPADIEADDDIFTNHEEPSLREPSDLDLNLPELVIDLTTLPPVGRAGAPAAGQGRAERERQRSINAQWARDLATLTGLGHAKVNAELNRLSGVPKVSEATVQQLEKRARAAADWFSKEQRRKAAARVR